MKILRTFLLIYAVLLCAGCVRGADVKFAYDYSTPLPSGFELRLSQIAGGPAIRTIDCGQLLTCTVPNVATGQWYARFYAYNVSIPEDALGREYSGPSNEVAFAIAAKPIPPTNNRIIVQTQGAELHGGDPTVIYLVFNEDSLR